jgi:hypothetical protein
VRFSGRSTSLPASARRPRLQACCWIRRDVRPRGEAPAGDELALFAGCRRRALTCFAVALVVGRGRPGVT